MDRFLPNRSVKRKRLLNRLWRCLRSSDNFDQRDDVWRIKGMSDENTLWMLAVRLHHARRNSGRARRDDGVDRSGIVHLREQLHLEIGTLGSVFLNEVRFR